MSAVAWRDFELTRLASSKMASEVSAVAWRDFELTRLVTSQ